LVFIHRGYVEETAAKFTGYFQVRTGCMKDNIFIFILGPNIRIRSNLITTDLYKNVSSADTSMLFVHNLTGAEQQE
jgi:hypothetical protein